MDKREFPISGLSIICQALFRLILTAFIGIILYPFIHMGFYLAVSIIFIPLFGIIWITFLMLTQTIILKDKGVLFKSYLRTSNITLDQLVSVKDVKGGRYIRFKSTKNSLLVPSRIKDWDELAEIIKSANPRIIINRYSKARRILRILSN